MTYAVLDRMAPLPALHIIRHPMVAQRLTPAEAGAKFVDPEGWKDDNPWKFGVQYVHPGHAAGMRGESGTTRSPAPICRFIDWAPC